MNEIRFQPFLRPAFLSVWCSLPEFSCVMGMGVVCSHTPTPYQSFGMGFLSFPPHSCILMMMTMMRVSNNNNLISQGCHPPFLSRTPKSHPPPCFPLPSLTLPSRELHMHDAFAFRPGISPNLFSFHLGAPAYLHVCVSRVCIYIAYIPFRKTITYISRKAYICNACLVISTYILILLALDRAVFSLSRLSCCSANLRNRSDGSIISLPGRYDITSHLAMCSREKQGQTRGQKKE